MRLFKDLIGLLAHGQKEGRQTKKKNWRKNVSTKMFSVYMGFKVWEYHLSTNAVRSQYYPVWKVKIYSGTDNFQTTSRQFVIHIYMRVVPILQSVHKKSNCFFFFVQKRTFVLGFQKSNCLYKRQQKNWTTRYTHTHTHKKRSAALSLSLSLSLCVVVFVVADGPRGGRGRGRRR